MNLNEGVLLTSVSTTTPVPINVLVTKNKFNFIRQSAINVTTSTSRSNLISSDNLYYYVGNLSAVPDQNVTTNKYPVLTFNSEGNISLNDYFNRKAVANTTSTFYYNPFANKNAKISSNNVYNFTVSPNITDADFIKIPLTGNDQLGIIEYQLSNADVSRKGTLTLNISPDGFASVSDYYNYSEVVEGASEQFVFSTGLTHSPYEVSSGTSMLNYITLTCSNFSAVEAKLEFNIDLTV
jgi:hypothetical protein